MMAAQPPKRPATVSRLVQATLLDQPAVGRLLSDQADATTALEQQVKRRSVLIADLAVGVNRLAHGLGRKALGATVTPTVADASFAWSFSVDGDRVAIITVVGVGQPNATVEVF